MADLWHYTSNGKQMDPIPTEELRKLAASGLVKPTDLVWREGMADWVRASAAKGLFEEGAGSQPSAAGPERSEDPRPRRRRPEEPGPRRLRPRDDSDRPRRANDGMSAGAKVAIVVGVVVLVVSSMVGGIIIVGNSSSRANNNFGGGPVAKEVGGGIGKNPAVYTVNLNQGQRDSRSFVFTAGRQYELRVNSDFDCDLDLHIWDNAGQNWAQNQVGPDHVFNWSPPMTGNYRIEIESFGARPCRSTVTIRDVGPGVAFNNPPPKANNPPPKVGGKPVAAKPGLITVGQGKAATRVGTLSNVDPPDHVTGQPCHVYEVRLEAGRSYQLDMMSKHFDTHLRLEDGLFFQLADDDDGGEGLNSRIHFDCNRTDTYRIICRPHRDVGPQGEYTLMVRRL